MSIEAATGGITRTARPRLGLAVFFLVAFGGTWAGWLVVRYVWAVENPFSSVRYYWFVASVSLAGFAAAYAGDGTAGLRRFCARIFNLRFTPWLLALGILLPLLAGALTFIPHTDDFLRGGMPKTVTALSAFTFFNFFTGPLAEEFGWRGYLLNWLGRYWPPALCGLIIGPIWVLWHLPLFFDSVFAHWTSALGFLVWTTSWSVVLALLVARARGSVVPSILGHWAMNNQVTLFAALLPALPHDHLPGGFSFTAASVIVAVVLTVLWREVTWQPIA